MWFGSALVHFSAYERPLCSKWFRQRGSAERSWLYSGKLSAHAFAQPDLGAPAQPAVAADRFAHEIVRGGCSGTAIDLPL
jgi:hypothetical protein